MSSKACGYGVVRSKSVLQRDSLVTCWGLARIEATRPHAAAKESHNPGIARLPGALDEALQRDAVAQIAGLQLDRWIALRQRRQVAHQQSQALPARGEKPDKMLA